MNKEPALIIGFIASALVALASIFHIVLDPDTVTGVITALIPLIAAFGIRQKVTPATPAAVAANTVVE